jgi:hypothetical protein
VLELDVRELGAQHGLDSDAPQARRFQYVRFVDRHDALATCLRQASGDARHALNLVDAVRAQVARELFRTAFLAEIDAAGQLAYEDDVGAAQNLGLERGDVQERGMNRDRPQVCKQVQPFAQCQQSLLGTNPGFRTRPLRSADCA